jgi:exopolysaccharide biosynthesis predicted pyruvyltransferase EpsI
LLLLTHPRSVFGQGGPCIGNLSDLYAAIQNKQTFVVETYILCPNTVYNVGLWNSTYDYEGAGRPFT